MVFYLKRWVRIAPTQSQRCPQGAGTQVQDKGTSQFTGPGPSSQYMVGHQIERQMAITQGYKWLFIAALFNWQI